MNRRTRQKLAITLAGAVIVLVASTLILWLIVTPAIVRSRVRGALADVGLTDVQFRVNAVSLWQARISDLRARGSENRIDRAVIRYSPSTLRRGKLTSIRVEGLTLALAVDSAGHVDFGLLKLRAPTAPVARGQFPIERIELASSQLLVQSPHQQFAVPVQGSAVRGEGGRLLMELDADADRPLAGRFTSEIIFEWQTGALNLNAQFTAKPQAPAASAKLGPTNLELTQGVFDIEGRFGNGPAALAVRVRDATLRGENLQADAINGELALNAPSRLTARNLAIGGLELTDGTVEFQMTHSQTIHVKQTQWNWLGGQLLANDFDIHGARAALDVQLREVELGKFLAMVANKQASGQGRLSGHVNLSINGSKVAFGGGQITAISRGTLRIADPESFVGVATTTGPRSVQQQVQSNIVEALKDFVYDQLTVELKPLPHDLIADIKIVGHGRTGAKQAIIYEPRISGLNSLLGSIFGLRQFLTDVQNEAGKAGP